MSMVTLVALIDLVLPVVGVITSIVLYRCERMPDPAHRSDIVDRWLVSPPHGIEQFPALAQASSILRASTPWGVARVLEENGIAYYVDAQNRPHPMPSQATPTPSQAYTPVLEDDPYLAGQIYLAQEERRYQ